MNYYPNYNPYFGQQMPQQPIQRMQQPITQPMQSMGLQGKSVDSIEVVKAMDIPLDRKRKLLSINKWNSYCY